MEKLRRSFAAALLILAMTCVALADGQMDIPLTSPTPQAQTATSSQEQTDTPPATSSTTAGQTDTTLTDAALILFQALSSIL